MSDEYMNQIRSVWRGLVFLLGHQLHHIVDPQYGYSSLSCKSNRVDLRYHWLKDTGLQIVSGSTLGQIQSAVFQLQSLWLGFSLLLRGGVKGSQFRN